DTLLLDAWYEPRTREHAFWSFDRIHPSAEGHRQIAASVAGLLGVPVEPAAGRPAAGSGVTVLRRYAREAAWLARYGLMVPARGLGACVSNSAGAAGAPLAAAGHGDWAPSGRSGSRHGGIEVARGARQRGLYV